jgi:uncharacterized repeat protein (TIGR01451 family)
MNRRWFAGLNGIVLSTVLAMPAFGQTVSQEPAADDSESADVQNGNKQTADGKSFLPKWFGRRSPQAQSAPQQSRTGNKQRTGTAKGQPQNAGPTPRVAARSRTSPTTQSQPSRERYALPGLGGSPLPQTGTNSTPAASAAPQPNTNAGPAASTSRPGSNQQPRTAALPGPTNGRKLQVAAPRSSPAAPTATRHSPNRRSGPHMSPEQLRRELVGTFPEPVATDPQAPQAEQVAEPATQPDATSEPTPTTAPQAEPVAVQPQTSPADTPMALPVDEQSVASAAPPAAISETPPETATALPLAAPPAKSTNMEPIAAPGRTPIFGKSNFVRAPRSISDATVQQSTRGKEAFGEALQVAGGGDPSVLVSNQTPVLTIDIRGPKQILVGREAIYRLKLQNQSDMPAEGIVASVRIPAWADVVNSTATQGMVQQTQDANGPGPLQWQLARLERRGSETLEMRLIPRESKPLELGVAWTLAPVGSRAIVEVQEPKLKLEVTGPSEVLFDKPQAFQLTLSNPGTGLAENVKIDLIPPGGDQSAATSHQIGDLAPGASQSVEVELTARDAGKMMVKAVASAEGGLISDASKEIFCRKPELEVDWRGPATKYAGTPATYFFRVRNPGTAPAEDVAVKISLPEGAEFTSASEGQVFDAQRREVSWNVGTLSPGDDNYLELKCLLKNAGSNQFKVTAATAKGELIDSKTAETSVVAIADLKLDVADPSGPVAVGNQAVYEIHVHNRGSNSAKEVNIVALFSEGIEPEQAEGAMYTVSDGRVSFKTIDDLPAGRDIVLRIRAHAVQPGTHIFRAEVLCRDLEIKLAAEETTRFYADDVNPEGNQTSPRTANRSEAFETTTR